MKLETLNMGAFQVNNYILFDEDSKEIVLIDAGGDFEMTKSAIDKYNGVLKYILNTHGHMDHIAGDADLQRHYNVPIFISKEDEFWLNSFKEVLKMVGMPDYDLADNFTFIEEGQVLKIGNKEIKIISTPGHTQGGVVFLIDDMLFSGDTLFFESIGRTDLPGGNHEQLLKTIKEKLYTLPENITVYPGHGQPTTIGHEKKNNFYV